MSQWSPIELSERVKQGMSDLFFAVINLSKKIFKKIFAILAISTDVDENDQNAKDNFTTTNLIEGSSLVEGVTGDGKKYIEQGVVSAPEP